MSPEAPVQPSLFEARPDHYHIHLPQFDGPFDLLLHFIQRDELDIYDIPISRITREFMAYIEAAQRLEINLASEFLAVAAQLMKIKARLLLPRPEVDEAGEEIDPRQDLVHQLLAYQQYKAAAEDLRRYEEQAFQQFRRLYASQEAQAVKGEPRPEDELMGMTVYQLMKVYERVLNKRSRQLEDPTHVIRPYPYDSEHIRTEIVDLLAHQPRIQFVDFLQRQPNRVFLVFSFLAVLELLTEGRIDVVIGEGYNNFWLTTV